ncbi:mechanosensitive ion channel family protein [Streptacidiphilus sp. EB129]|jgi:small-conductance mechanosensitive channel|uniref:mechanosensitive ion channel family protein n=1 Tax=Streptacidiphilus sp. EB129 TaxID=3156262 RepID=UPI0035112341
MEQEHGADPEGGTAGPAGKPPRGDGRWRGAIRTRRAIVTTTLAVAGLVISSTYGGLLGEPGAHNHLVYRLIAGVSAIVFLVFALIAVRGATDDLLRLLPHRFGDARTAPLRVICLLSGYALVILGALSLLQVPWSRLILGGALTGVILGIAAQPVLGNIFAGLVLLVARPFTVGEEISVQSGPLGGRIYGEVTDMTLIFVELRTSEGPMLLPNTAVLSAAIGPPVRPGSGVTS